MTREPEPWFEALRDRRSQDFDGEAHLTNDELDALLEIAAAAREFIGTTTVFRQRKVSRDAFTRLAVAVFWPDDARAANSQKEQP